MAVHSYIYGDFSVRQAQPWLAEAYALAHPGKALTYRYANVDINETELDIMDVVDLVRSDLSIGWVDNYGYIHGDSPAFIALSFYGHDDIANYVTLFTDALTRIVAAADYVGVPVYWIESAPRHSTDTPSLRTTMSTIADGLGCTVIYAGDAVDGASRTYVTSMTCLFGEGVLQGCSAGSVVVRDTDLKSFKFASPTYSSGALRWAYAAVSGLPAPAAPGTCTIWDCP